MTDHFVEVPKKVLSPTAQAVLDAFLAEWADCFLEQDRRCLGAALRALADRMIGLIPDVHSHAFAKGVNAAAAFAGAIATELEGQP